MSFALKVVDDLPGEARRVLDDQMVSALQKLAQNGGYHPQESIHFARKRLKRVRSCLRLLKDALGKEAYARENNRFRQIAHGLEPVRSADAALETTERLREFAGDRFDLSSLSKMEERLEQARTQVYNQAVYRDKVHERAADQLFHATQALRHLPLDGLDWKELKDGLERIYAKGRSAFKAAKKNPDAEQLHDWRKRVKDLWYALDLIKRIRPPHLRGLRDGARLLADLLGQEHDLAELENILERHCEREAEAKLEELRRKRDEAIEAARQREEGGFLIVGPPVTGPVKTGLEPLQEAIAAERQKLQAECFKLGKTVYASIPEDYAEYLLGYLRLRPIAEAA